MTDQSTQIPPKKISIRPHMFDSPESASLWFDIFNGVLFTGALLVTIGTWGTIRTAGIKERFSDERIAVNESETRRAIAESDIAKEGTAKANERIAELSTQAERLRKDTAEANARALEAQANLEKFRAPRLLTNEQAFALISALSSFKGHNVAVGASPQTFETASLAEQLVTVL